MQKYKKRKILLLDKNIFYTLAAIFTNDLILI